MTRMHEDDGDVSLILHQPAVLYFIKILIFNVVDIVFLIKHGSSFIKISLAMQWD